MKTDRILGGESLDSALPDEAIQRISRNEYRFMIEGLDYRMVFERKSFVKSIIGKATYELSFQAMVHRDVWTHALVDVGAKAARIVFATVVKIAKAWLAEVKPYSIVFLSDKTPGESRTTFYKTLSKLLLPKGYDLTVKEDPAFAKFTMTKQAA